MGHSQLPNRYPEVPLLNTELPFLLVLMAHEWSWFPHKATTCCDVLRTGALSDCSEDCFSFSDCYLLSVIVRHHYIKDTPSPFIF